MYFSNNIPLRVNGIVDEMLGHIRPRICNFVIKATRGSPTFFSWPPPIIKTPAPSFPGCMNALVERIQVWTVRRISSDGPVPTGLPTSRSKLNSPTRPSLLIVFNGSTIILSYDANQISYLWDNYTQWNIFKAVFILETMHMTHRENSETISGCFEKIFFWVLWSLQKFLTKIWEPSKLSQHNFQLFFRDSIFSWENVLRTWEKERQVHHTLYFWTYFVSFS